MKNNCDIENRLQKGVEDILDNPHLKGNPFTLPKGYFSKMETQLQDVIHNQKRVESPILGTIRTSFAMVAMFALVFGLAYGVFSITDTGIISKAEQVDTFASTEIDEVKESMSDEELLQHYGSYDAYSAETLEAINVITPSVNKDEIEQYLIDSNLPSLMILAALE